MKLIFVRLITVILIVLLAGCAPSAAVTNTPAVNAASSLPSASPTAQPTATPSPSPTPTPAKMADLILEAKWWETAQFVVWDEEAAKEENKEIAKERGMDEETVEAQLKAAIDLPRIFFYPDLDTDKGIPIFAPYDGVAQIDTLHSYNDEHQEVATLMVINFARLDGEWDGNWDYEKFSKEEYFPFDIFAVKMQPAEGMGPDGAAVKKGKIVGYVVSDEMVNWGVYKNEGIILLSASYGSDIYKTSASPYEFLSKYLEIDQP